MTAQATSLEPAAVGSQPAGVLLGFRTIFGKELTDWVRGRKALIVTAVSTAAAIFMTLIPFIARASGEAQDAGLLSMDPTTNVLVGWTGQTVAFISIVATMSLLSTERDRGTLAWTLTNPVSPTSIIAAKFLAAFAVLSVTAVFVPLAVSVGLATIVYNGVPDLAVVGSFALLGLAAPAFFVALTVGLGTAIPSTAGVAGAAFAVIFAPQLIGGIVPLGNELSPTSIGPWAMAVAKGQAVSLLPLAGWAVAMVAIAFAAKLTFERQEH